MPIKRALRDLFKKLQQLPLEITIPAAVLIVVGIFYSLAFFVDRHVSFSYAGPTCVRQLTFLPGLHRISGESDYIARVSDKIQVGGITLASFSVCFTPKEIPQPGETKVSTAPWGGWLARKTYTIKVDHPVVAHMDKLTRPVPVSRPLAVDLSGSDKVFSYKLKLGTKQASCRSLDAKVACDVHTLDLVQGQSYPAELERYFAGKKVAAVAKKHLTILSATKVTDSSIKGGETVCAKPATIDLTFDKTITKAAPELYRIEGEKRTKVPLATKVADKKVHLSLSKELPRSADYELVTSGVVASDGSSLEETHRLAPRSQG